jgi:hypothetical protein
MSPQLTGNGENFELMRGLLGILEEMEAVLGKKDLDRLGKMYHPDFHRGKLISRGFSSQ